MEDFIKEQSLLWLSNKETILGGTEIVKALLKVIEEKNAEIQELRKNIMLGR